MNAVRIISQTVLMFLLAVSLIGCQKVDTVSNVEPEVLSDPFSPLLQPIGVPYSNGNNYSVVKSRVILALATGKAPKSRAALGAMTIDDSGFTTPNFSKAVLDFGRLELSSINDDDLNHCGADGTRHCGTAIIRVYTMGEPDFGFYNLNGGYGIPLFMGLVGRGSGFVGLGPDAALTVAAISIADSQSILTLNDFPDRNISVEIDFSQESGTDTYETNLVIEYVLVN